MGDNFSLSSLYSQLWQIDARFRPVSGHQRPQHEERFIAATIPPAGAAFLLPYKVLHYIPLRPHKHDLRSLPHHPPRRRRGLHPQRHLRRCRRPQHLYHRFSRCRLRSDRHLRHLRPLQPNPAGRRPPRRPAGRRRPRPGFLPRGQGRPLLAAARHPGEAGSVDQVHLDPRLVPGRGPSAGGCCTGLPGAVPERAGVGCHGAVLGWEGGRSRLRTGHAFHRVGSGASRTHGSGGRAAADNPAHRAGVQGRARRGGGGVCENDRRERAGRARGDLQDHVAWLDGGPRQPGGRGESGRV